MDIPANAVVYCDNEVCGQVTSIVINPVTEQVTHIVVQETNLPYVERLVPVEYVLHSTADHIGLRCDHRELEKMEPFVETELIDSSEVEYKFSFPGMEALPYLFWPYVSPDQTYFTQEAEHVPQGELAIRRGAVVEARDGWVGEVDEFLVDPENCDITHLILRKGHAWVPRDVFIPVFAIERITENTVYLNLDTSSVEDLPAIPVERKWK